MAVSEWFLSSKKAWYRHYGTYTDNFFSCLPIKLEHSWRHLHFSSVRGIWWKSLHILDYRHISCKFLFFIFQIDKFSISIIFPVEIHSFWEKFSSVYDSVLEYFHLFHFRQQKNALKSNKNNNYKRFLRWYLGTNARCNVQVLSIK